MALSKQQTKKFAKVNIDQALWLASQEPCVMQLFFFSIASSQFSSRFEPLVYKMSVNSFKKARQTLEQASYFEYREEIGRLSSGKIGILGYQVRNLMGELEEPIKTDSQASINQKPDNQNLIEQNQSDDVENQKLKSDDHLLMSDDQNLMPENQNLIAEDQNLTLMRGKTLTNQGQNSLLDLIKTNLDLNKTNLDLNLDQEKNKQDLDLLVGREETANSLINNFEESKRVEESQVTGLSVEEIRELDEELTESWLSPFGDNYLISKKQKEDFQLALFGIESNASKFSHLGGTKENLTEYRFTNVLDGQWVRKNGKLEQVKKNVSILLASRTA